jgi:integrase
MSWRWSPQAMPDELRLAVQLDAWCALRYGEVFELRRKDLDAIRGVVQVRRGVVWTKGLVTNDRPKTSAGVRDVAIPPHLMPMVTDHLERHVDSRPALPDRPRESGKDAFEGEIGGYVTAALGRRPGAAQPPGRMTMTRTKHPTLPNTACGVWASSGPTICVIRFGSW